MELDVLPPEFSLTPTLAPARLVRGARHGIVRVTRRFRVSRERVFDAWLDPRIAGKWLFATASRPMTRVTLDARVGGRFCFVERHYGEDVTHAGKYTEIARPGRLTFTLSMENRPHATTRVAVKILPLRSGCELIVAHEGVPPDCAARISDRWTGILYGLGETLSGFPARRYASVVSDITGSERLRQVLRA